MKENSIMYDLNAVTVCFFARDNPEEFSESRSTESSGSDNECLYSYAVPGDHNELTVCTYPTLRVLIQGVRRYWNSSVLCDLKRRKKERRQFPYFYLGIETRVEIYNNEK